MVRAWDGVSNVTAFHDHIKLRLNQSDTLKSSHDQIATVVEDAILEYARRLDSHEPVTEEMIMTVVTEEWAEAERKRVTEELRQLYADMSEMRDRMRALFPSLKDPGSCSICGKHFIRGDRVNPLADGSLKCLRCEGGLTQEEFERQRLANNAANIERLEQASRDAVEKAVSDAAWITFQDRQGGA